MQEILKTTLIGLFFGTFGTTIGGIIGVVTKKHSKKFLSFVLAFASGLMMAIICFDLMPEALAISNIVKNALDHTTAGNNVTIEWKQLPSVTRICIKDNGSGIHPEDIHHIFKRFYRSRVSTDTQGIGLGLPLAKAIIEAHDGNITVDSVLGKGSTFTISFLNPTKL